MRALLAAIALLASMTFFVALLRNDAVEDWCYAIFYDSVLSERLEGWW